MSQPVEVFFPETGSKGQDLALKGLYQYFRSPHISPSPLAHRPPWPPPPPWLCTNTYPQNSAPAETLPLWAHEMAQVGWCRTSSVSTVGKIAWQMFVYSARAGVECPLHKPHCTQYNLHLGSKFGRILQTR